MANKKYFHTTQDNVNSLINSLINVSLMKLIV